MKTVTTILAAAFIAGTASLALAQGGGAAGGGGSDVNPDRLGKGADQNPSSPGSNPAAGNKDATTAGQAKTGPAAGSAKTGTMTTAPVAGTKNDSSKPSQAPTGTTK